MKSCPLLGALMVVMMFSAWLSRSGGADEGSRLPYQDPRRPVDDRVADLLGRMTLDEKLEMLNGTGFESKPTARLGIPPIRMTDGPQGVRLVSRAPQGAAANPGAPAPVIVDGQAVVIEPGYSTAFPAGVTLASTWNPEVVRQVGRAIARECKALGKDMLLAPCVNIQRVPHGGRNFESYSEDPYLAARMAVAYIEGVQREGVIATVKHFAVNNQENQRMTVSAKVDERVLHEIFFPAFKAAVQEAGVWSVMSAYNKVNGLWCAENPHLLTDVLKNQWGFQGFVVSDWGGTHATAATLNAGLDLEMPRAKALSSQLVSAEIASGQVKPEAIDDKIRRMLRVMFAMGLFDRGGATPAPLDRAQSLTAARAAAAGGIVLLKNQGEPLPLDVTKLTSIAVIGPCANVPRLGGGGSATVRSTTAASPLDALRTLVAGRAQVGFALGAAMPGEDPANETPEAKARLLAEAAELAAKSAVALVFIGNSGRIETEGRDRTSLELAPGQNELVEAVLKANPNTVVVLNVGAPVLLGDWIERIPAVVNAWFGGEAGGPAIADVLAGAVNPSGRLPETFPRRWEDSPAYGRYPGADGVVGYDEGLYVGYRHFDKQKLEPLFPFGHGLSYTKFDYSGLEVTPQKLEPGAKVTAKLTLKNSGSREGAEVVQVYVRDVASSVDRPVKELKAFRRVVLKPGESQAVSFELDKNAMAFYDPAKTDWVAEPGAFEVLIGSSSRDIRLTGSFELTP